MANNLMESAENRYEEKEMDPSAGWEDFMEEFGSLFKEGNKPLLIVTTYLRDVNNPIMKYLDASTGEQQDIQEMVGFET